MSDQSSRPPMTRFLVRAVIVAGVCGAVTYGITFMFARRYQADEVIYFPGGSQQTGSLSSLLTGKAPAGQDGSVGLLNNAVSSPIISSVDTAFAITKSAGCLKYVIDKNDLMNVWHEHRLSKAMKKLGDRLNTNVDKQGMLNISATDEDMARAEAIARSTEEYLRKTADRLSLNPSEKNVKLVEAQLAEAQAQEHHMKATVMKTLSKQPLSQEVSERAKAIWAIKQAAVEARIKASGAAVELNTYGSQMRSLVKNSNSTQGVILDLSYLSKGLGDLMTELANRQVALEDAAKTFTHKSPQYKKAAQEFASAQKVSNSLLKQQAFLLNQGQEPTMIQARATLESLAKEAGQYEAAADELTAQLSKDAGGYVDNEVLKQYFSASVGRVVELRRDLDLAKIAAARDPARFEVLDPASASDEPVFPKRALSAGVVFFLVLLLQLTPMLFGSSKSAETTA